MPIAAGSFRSDTTTGIDPSSPTGLGFTPAAVVVAVMLSDFSDTTLSGEIFASYTICDGTTTRCAAVRGDHGISTSATARAWYDNIVTISATASVLIEGEITFNSDGFDIDWTTADGSAWSVCWWAIGGAGISASLLLFNRSTTGTASVTGSGFEPKALIALGTGTADAPTATASDAFALIGLCDETVDQAGLGIAIQDGAGAANSSYRLSDTNILTRSTTSGVLDTAITITSLDGNGFSYDATNHPASARYYAVLCLGGDGITATEIADLQADATSGAHTQTMSFLSFEPNGGFAISAGQTAYTAGNSAAMACGAFNDDLDQWGHIINDRDGQPVMNSREVCSNTSALLAFSMTGIPQSYQAVGAIGNLTSSSLDVTWLASKAAFQFLWPTLTFALAEVPDVTGTMAGTFGALTGAMNGTVIAPVSGVLTGTFGALTGAMTGSVGSLVTGTLAGTFGGLTGTALGDTPTTAHLTGVFGALTATMTGIPFDPMVLRADLLPSKWLVDLEPSPWRAELNPDNLIYGTMSGTFGGLSATMTGS